MRGGYGEQDHDTFRGVVLHNFGAHLPQALPANLSAAAVVATAELLLPRHGTALATLHDDGVLVVITASYLVWRDRDAVHDLPLDQISFNYEVEGAAGDDSKPSLDRVRFAGCGSWVRADSASDLAMLLNVLGFPMRRNERAD